MKEAGFSPTVMKSVGVSISDMKAAGFSASDLVAAKYSVSDLKSAGYSVSDMKTAGYSPSILKSVGFSLSDLRSAGFTASELVAAKYTLSDLKAVGYSVTDFRKAGFSPSIMKSAGYSVSDMKVAGFSVSDLKGARFSTSDLIAAEYTVSDLKAGGYKAVDLREAGCSVGDLKAAGCSVVDMKYSGFSASDMKAAGFNVSDIKAAGFNVSDIKEAGFRVSDMKTAGYSPSILKSVGFSLSDLRLAGFTASELVAAKYTLSDLKAVGFTSTQLKNEGYILSHLKSAGYSISDMKAAGFILRDFKAAGYSASDMKSAGFSPSDLKWAGFSVSSLKYAGFSASDMKSAGFSPSILKSAGFSVSDLKGTGFGVSELITANYDVVDLKAAGYSASDFIEALKSGITSEDLATELRVAGYSLTEIRAAGVNATLLKKSFGCDSSELRRAGYSAFETMITGCSTTELISAGYTLNELKSAGLGPTELITAGFTPSELKDCGFLAYEMKLARIPPSAMKALGYTITEMKEAGYTLNELKSAGLGPEELITAGFTPSELKDCGFLAYEMKLARIPPSAMKAAGYTISEMKEVGYSLEELKMIGFSLIDMKSAGIALSELTTLGYTMSEVSAEDFDLPNLKTAETQSKTDEYTVLELKSDDLSEVMKAEVLSSSSLPPPPSLASLHQKDNFSESDMASLYSNEALNQENGYLGTNFESLHIRRQNLQQKRPIAICKSNELGISNYGRIRNITTKSLETKCFVESDYTPVILTNTVLIASKLEDLDKEDIEISVSHDFIKNQVDMLEAKYNQSDSEPANATLLVARDILQNSQSPVISFETDLTFSGHKVKDLPTLRIPLYASSPFKSDIVTLSQNLILMTSELSAQDPTCTLEKFRPCTEDDYVEADVEIQLNNDSQLFECFYVVKLKHFCCFLVGKKPDCFVDCTSRKLLVFVNRNSYGYEATTVELRIALIQEETGSFDIRKCTQSERFKTSDYVLIDDSIYVQVHGWPEVADILLVSPRNETIWFSQSKKTYQICLLKANDEAFFEFIESQHLDQGHIIINSNTTLTSDELKFSDRNLLITSKHDIDVFIEIKLYDASMLSKRTQQLSDSSGISFSTTLSEMLPDIYISFSPIKEDTKIIVDELKAILLRRGRKVLITGDSSPDHAKKMLYGSSLVLIVGTDDYGPPLNLPGRPKQPSGNINDASLELDWILKTICRSKPVALINLCDQSPSEIFKGKEASKLLPLPCIIPCLGGVVTESVVNTIVDKLYGNIELKLMKQSDWLKVWRWRFVKLEFGILSISRSSDAKPHLQINLHESKVKWIGSRGIFIIGFEKSHKEYAFKLNDEHSTEHIYKQLVLWTKKSVDEVTSNDDHEVFFSMRFNNDDLIASAKRVQEDLRRFHNIKALIVNTEVGQSIVSKVAKSVTQAKLVVIFGTEDYADDSHNQANSQAELKFIMDNNMPYYFIRIFDPSKGGKFKHAYPRFKLLVNDTLAFPWDPKDLQNVPPGLVDDIAARYRNLPSS